MQNPYSDEPERLLFTDKEDAVAEPYSPVAFASNENFPASEPDTNPPPPSRSQGRNLWPKIRAALVLIVAVGIAMVGGMLDGRATAPKPTYQMVTQDVTVAGLQGGAMTGRDVHFTAKVERVAPGAFVFALVSDPKKSMDMAVVLIPALDTVVAGQTVQVWGYDYGLFVAPAGLETLIVAEIVRHG